MCEAYIVNISVIGVAVNSRNGTFGNNVSTVLLFGKCHPFVR